MNFRRVYELATGKYYKQAAHDDFCEPEFFETCIRALELDPGLTVAYTKTRVVVGTGHFSKIMNANCARMTQIR